MTVVKEQSDGVAGGRRGRKRRERLERRQVLGLPQIRFIEGLIDALRKHGDHPNRKLFLDDLFIAQLLAFYNPVARSLRGIEDASQMPGINQYLEVDAIKRSTAGDAMATFDADLLLPLIHALRARVNAHQMDQADDTLRGLMNRLMAFDGSYFRTTNDAAWALRERHGARVRSRVRLNLHLSVRTGVPEGVSLAGQGDPSESAALLDEAHAGQIVVADRGCFSHETVHQLLERGADFVLRLQKSVCCQVIAQRPLTDADRAVGVISDQTVLLTGGKNPYPPTPLRLVTIRPAPGSDGDSSRRDSATPPDERSDIRVLTSIQDQTVPAWMIGHVYRRRWDVELYFRWLKTIARWNHLLSEHKNGMLMQFYVAVIGTLLLAAATGRKPDQYAFNLMCMVAQGHGSAEDALAIYEKRCAERDRDREQRKRRQRQRAQTNA